MKKLILMLTVMTTSLYFISCMDDNTIPTEPLPVISASFIQVIQEGTIEEVTSELEATLTEKGFNIPAFSPIKHDVAAAGVDLELRPTRLYIFGNPKAGTVLMQENQQIGIDLPLKMLAFTNENDQNILGYYSATTLARRYAIKNSALVSRIDSTLYEISGINSTRPIIVQDETTPPLKEKLSTKNLDSTLTQLKTAITDRDFTILGEVAHDIAAQSVNLELRPTRVIIFGKPQGGTLLMQSDQTVGVDLPLKVLVYESEDGAIRVAYYGSDFLKDRYNLNDRAPVLENINNALEAITNDAIK